ncbi:MAG TPA: M20/M25/M40 family metallo-hydrolase [Bacteroidales bacterium]|nr:M20/M25/M40 family metallo-hydrolase [Bacteroidales bacterium]
MKSLNYLATLIVLIFFPVLVNAQTETVDLNMIYRIKQEGMKNSAIEELAFGLTDLSGSRLTGSPGLARGNEWAMKKMLELGFQNVRIEEAADFSQGGWDNLKTYAAMISPYYINFACNPVAWTGSTNGPVKAEVILLDVKTEEDLDKYKGKLSGKIVMMPSTASYEVSFEPLATRYTDDELKELSMAAVRPQGGRVPADWANYMAQRALQMKITGFLKSEGVAVILNNSGFFNVPRSASASYKAGDPEPVPQLSIPVEAYGRMERLIAHSVRVEMEIEIINKFLGPQKVYNVIGEIPGTDKLLKNEVVLLGAHIDSWHGGTGAADNASGCVVMMEALRILKNLDVAPRRTIRVALWGGEEQGLIGSRAYADKFLADRETKAHKPDFDRFAAYFNMDNGTGKYRGIYTQENDMVRPIFEEWLKPFADMGAATVSGRNTGGTDHLSFDAYGLPAFQFIQDNIEYGRGFHSVMDTYERLLMNDLRHNAIITAAFAYNAAMRNSKLPSKPAMKPATNVKQPQMAPWMN